VNALGRRSLQPPLLGWLCSLVLGLAWANPLFAAGDGDCTGLEDQLIGVWQNTGGPGFFEAMSFSTDGQSRRFDSWLHDRPDVTDASWSVEGCRLVISTRGDGLGPFEYSIAMDTHELRLQEREGDVAIYSRYGNPP